MRRARLGRYALWQLRDYALNQGLSTMVVLLLAGFLTVPPLRAAAHRFGQAGSAPGPLPPELLEQVVRQLTGLMVFLGALFATNGIVSGDRKFGYYRFYFAKPVSPPTFYALQFGAHAVGFAVVAHLLIAIFSAAVQPVYPARFALVVIGLYLAYAGIGFFVSTVSRYDWLSLLTVVLAAQIAWSTWPDAHGWRGVLVRLLPPITRSDHVYAAMGVIPAAAGAPDFPWRSFLWLAGYGAAAFVAGLVVLRRRPLGAGN